MVRIEYTTDMDRYTVTLEGHAGTSDNGDPHYLCSAVSALFYSLGQKLMMMDDEGYIDYIKCEDEGDVKEITASSKLYTETLYHIFDTIMCGFCMLSEQYPANIEVVG